MPFHTRIMNGVEIRAYSPSDCAEIVQLFYDTVHAVCVGDYSPEQLQAWAPGLPDVDAWNESFLVHDTLVAEVEGQIVGFADMDAAGYLDRLYVHKDWQRQGVATALCEALERRCPASRFTTHASLTARPFFEGRGYRVVREQEVERYGLLLTNFVMERTR